KAASPHATHHGTSSILRCRRHPSRTPASFVMDAGLRGPILGPSGTAQHRRATSSRLLARATTVPRAVTSSSAATERNMALESIFPRGGEATWCLDGDTVTCTRDEAAALCPRSCFPPCDSSAREFRGAARALNLP